MESQRHQFRLRSGERSGSRRRRRRVPTHGTRGVHPEPLVNAIGVETVFALWDAPYAIIRLVVR